MLALVLARLVHEVRSPLQAVRGFGRLLEDRVAPEHRELAHKLVLATTQLEAVVDEIASPASWLDPRSSTAPPPSNATVAEVLERVIAVVQLDAEERQVMVVIDVEASVAKSLVPRSMSPAQLVQVLVNLLANALRFSPPQGRVTVSVTRHPRLRFRISDEGPGVDPADAQRIFQPFERGGDRSGVGLGLFIARTILEGAGGRVELESTETGSPGASFVVEIPEGR